MMLVVVQLLVLVFSTVQTYIGGISDHYPTTTSQLWGQSGLRDFPVTDSNQRVDKGL